MSDIQHNLQRSGLMEAFTRSFLEQDIPGLGSKVAPEALGRFWRMLAHFHGQTWNAAELGVQWMWA